MAEINKNYPDKCSEEEIKKLIRGYSDEIFENKGNINTILHFTPLIQLGLSELQGRQNKRIAYLSLAISGLSLLVAGVSLLVLIFV